MNYIRHLTGFFDRAGKDHRLNATHISLYMSVFQLWNLNRFKNPISISRSELMELSKVSSKCTYHKCLKELHQYGYLRYDPSYHPLRGSWVYLFTFKASEDTSQYKNKTGDEQDTGQQQDSGVPEENRSSAESHASSELQGSLNIYKHNKHNKHSFSTERKIAGSQEREKNDAGEIKNNPLPGAENVCIDNPARIGKDSPTAEIKPGIKQKPNEPEKIPAGPEEVQQYFQVSGFPESQALKFFHYYTATGWKVGGKAPIQNWHAAAHSWMLNPQNTETHASKDRQHQPAHGSNQLHNTANKDYSEPL